MNSNRPLRSSSKLNLELQSDVISLSQRREPITWSLFIYLQNPTPSHMAPLMAKLTQNLVCLIAAVVPTIFNFLRNTLLPLIPYKNNTNCALRLYQFSLVCLTLAHLNPPTTKLSFVPLSYSMPGISTCKY